jgi:hypothetical protein
MKPNENLDTTRYNIKEARKAAHELFSLIEGNNIREKRLRFLKNLLKSFCYSALLLFAMILIAKIL